MILKHYACAISNVNDMQSKAGNALPLRADALLTANLNKYECVFMKKEVDEKQSPDSLYINQRRLEQKETF